MLNSLLRLAIKLLLALRYRVRVRGLRDVARRGTRGIVFLPNHPALIDPILLMAYLHDPFAPRALADQDQIDRPFIRWLARRMNVRPIPDVVRYGTDGRDEVRQKLEAGIAGLSEGENMLLYPSGRVYRSRYEDVGASRSAHRVLREAGDARVVLVRTTGLWGSHFGWAGGSQPDLGKVLLKAIGSLLANAVLFSPRREVTIELVEPADLPRRADRAELNHYLDRFYNRVAPPNTYVPWTVWESGRTRAVPEPSPPSVGRAVSVSVVPKDVRDAVARQIAEMAGRESVQPTDRLAHDVGLDSLAGAELTAWIAEQYGITDVDVASLLTVADAMRAAAGLPVGPAGASALKPAPPEWFRDARPRRRLISDAGVPPASPEGILPSESSHAAGGTPAERADKMSASRPTRPPAANVAELFLANARRDPARLIVTDQAGGPKTYRDLVLGILVLKHEIARLPGDHVAIMLPASVAACATYLACLFAGKTPVMLNWTVGRRHLGPSLDLVGARHVLTSRRLVERIDRQGDDLADIRDRLFCLEDVRQRLGPLAKLRAFAASRLSWRSLDPSRAPDRAAVLFTSGSETQPKAVPYTHANLLANLTDVPRALRLYTDDRLLSFLPPFHSFGLTVAMLVPLCLDLRAVFHPNPNESATLAGLIGTHRPTLMIATPTFARAIVRRARPGQTDSLRLIVTGTEKCPEAVYDLLAERCPNATVCEGYGVTECSPVVAVNDDQAPVRGSIGRLLPSFRKRIVDPESLAPVAPGQAGMLLLAGPCVFGGYLNPDAPSPFVEVEGERWYRTGDLVSEGPDGLLSFRGRLKRFIKLGGEMVSLPLVEHVLLDRYQPPDADEPVLAVEHGHEEHAPALVLFTTLDLSATDANAVLREAGLSALHNIRRTVRVESIPLLGTGKADYRRLRAMLEV